MTRKQIKGHVALVVGGAGFIGSHLVDSLLKEGAQEVVVVDSLFTGSEKNHVSAIKSGRTVFYREDAEFATNLSYIGQIHHIDMAFNCATRLPDLKNSTLDFFAKFDLASSNILSYVD